MSFLFSREGVAQPALPLPERPRFPPAELQLAPAFPPELGDALGSELLMVWAFLHSFGELLGLWPATVDELLTAFALGERSRLLGEIHVGVLRLLQADMEEAHASGVSQVRAHSALTAVRSTPQAAASCGCLCCAVHVIQQ